MFATQTFDPDAVKPGQEATLARDVTRLATGELVRLPLPVARGAAPGKTVVVLGGIHGDEYEGMAAVRAVFRGLDPATMRGTFLGVPVCNPLAFAAAALHALETGIERLAEDHANARWLAEQLAGIPGLRVVPERAACWRTRSEAASGLSRTSTSIAPRWRGRWRSSPTLPA